MVGLGVLLGLQWLLLWVMLEGSSGEEEELLGRIESWERIERNRFFILFDSVVYIILMRRI